MKLTVYLQELDFLTVSSFLGRKDPSSLGRIERPKEEEILLITPLLKGRKSLTIHTIYIIFTSIG
jgi:hypothetical protein